MGDPVLHVLAGPNGAGKSELWKRLLGPVLHLEFFNADDIAKAHWPDDPEANSYEAAAFAAAARDQRISERRSFATETVFSHESKVRLVDSAVAAGYLVTMHVLLVPVHLAVARVEDRVANGGHFVPETKVRERFERLWAHIADAAPRCETVAFYDSTTTRFRVVAELERGEVLWADWPRWAPRELLALG